MLDGQISGRINNISSKEWTGLVNIMTSGQVNGKMKSVYRSGLTPKPMPRLRSLSPQAQEIINRGYGYDIEIGNPTSKIANSEFKKRGEYFSRMADRVNRERKWHILSELIAALAHNQPIMTPAQESSYNMSTAFLHLALGSANRFLVGLKDGAHWAEGVELPFVDTFVNNSMLDMFFYFVNFHMHLRKQDLDLVPRQLIHQEMQSKVRFPTINKSLTDALKGAYFGKYVLGDNTATVKLQGRHNINEVALKVLDGHLLSKISTTHGDGFSGIDLDKAVVLNDARSGGLTSVSEWSGLTAAIYHDILVNEHISVEGESELVDPLPIRTLQDLNTRPQRPYQIIIPRKYVDSNGHPQFRLEGERRSPVPHVVKYSTPNVPMTPRHEQELLVWAKEHGVTLPEVPKGHTLRRPHLSPKGVDLVSYPTFIRKEVEEEISEQEKLLLAKIREMSADQADLKKLETAPPINSSE